MELGDEFIAVVFRHRHECSTHDYEFNFIDCVAESLELLDSVSGLFVRIVAGSDGAHACWFVAGIALCAVVKV